MTLNRSVHITIQQDTKHHRAGSRYCNRKYPMQAQANQREVEKVGRNGERSTVSKMEYLGRAKD